jgi:S1-C subfamily serine protease
MRPGETVSATGSPEQPPDHRVPRRRVLVVGAVVLVVVLALVLWWVVPSGPAPLTQADVDAAVQRGIEQAQQQEAATPPDGAIAYQQIGPSLVSVTSTRDGGGTMDTTLGAGVVVNADGTVLTALHVVDGASRITVRFADGSEAGASVAASQPDNDVAALAVDQLPQVVVPAVLAGPPGIGEPVFAVGNPLGLERSLSAGVVSADDRKIDTGAGRTLSGLIQFDAAVNPGNSGGPLLNRAGQVVGLVTALANPARQDFFVGIGFAVPIASAGGAGGPQQ